MDTIEIGKWATLHEDDPRVSGLLSRMTVDNPQYESASRMGFSTAGMDRRIELFERTGRYVRFPRAVVAPYLKEATPGIVDLTVAGEAWDIASNIKLRDRQGPFVDDLEYLLQTQYGTIGQAEPGFGKTVCTLELIARMGRKAIILVTKEFLMTQWVERILGTKEAARKLGLPVSAMGSKMEPPMLGLTPEQVGIVQQDRCEWEGKAIVIAMAQSLLARDYGESFYESFGFLGIDEVHNFAAPTFRQTIIKFPARYRLGVTATPERKDGLEDIFFAHIGRIGAKGAPRKEKPRVNMVKTPVQMTREGQRLIQRYDGREDMNKVLDFLTNHEARNRQLVKLMLNAAAKGRKILLLSGRRQHLYDLRDLFLEGCRERQLAVSTDYYIGGMNLEERKRAEKMQVLFATYAMAKEGLDIPSLDTLFLATPVGDTTQAVGRILRSADEKKQPVVVDLVDVHIKLCNRLAEKREREYRGLGWMGEKSR